MHGCLDATDVNIDIWKQLIYHETNGGPKPADLYRVDPVAGVFDLKAVKNVWGSGCAYSQLDGLPLAALTLLAFRVRGR